MNWCAARTAPASSGGPAAQPIFQPVSEKVLPKEEIVIVRSDRYTIDDPQFQAQVLALGKRAPNAQRSASDRSLQVTPRATPARG